MKHNFFHYLLGLFAIALVIYILKYTLLASILSNFPKSFMKLKSEIDIKEDNIYLVVDEEYNLNLNNVTYSFDNNIISINNGVIKGLNVGNTTLTVKNETSEDSVNIIVTDLITKPILNNKKSLLTCEKYNSEDASTLDKILEYEINKVGYKTRAGVVEAARFLTLRFKYRLAYFYENGRLKNYDRTYCDGEGRWYHKGLYLSSDKYSLLSASVKGPAMWGCPLYSNVVKNDAINGLDCSGFVTWTLLNGGYDVGDVGSGIYVDKTDDLDDLGDKIYINEESVNNTFKVGDLIGFDGHIGIIIGYKDGYYYIAQAYEYDLNVQVMNNEDLINSRWDYIIDMNNLYGEDGNLSSFWE